MPLDRLMQALKEAEVVIGRDTPLKEKAKAVRKAISRVADGLGIDLRLRK